MILRPHPASAAAQGRLTPPGDKSISHRALILSCLAKHKDDRPASAQALADALDQLDIAPWTRADAQRWWERYGPLVEEQRESFVPRITGHTMDVVIDEPWFEGAANAAQKP